MTRKGYSIFHQIPRLELRYQIGLSHNRTLVGGVGLTPQQGCSRCILLSQPTGLYIICVIIYECICVYVDSMEEN